MFQKFNGVRVAALTLLCLCALPWACSSEAGVTPDAAAEQGPRDMGTPDCTPICAAKQQCGPDGCGGICGTCPAHQVCTGNTCAIRECGWRGLVLLEGCCLGKTLLYCDTQFRLHRQICGSADECGWNALAERYTCNTDGQEMPKGAKSIWVPRECPSTK